MLTVATIGGCKGEALDARIRTDGVYKSDVSFEEYNGDPIWSYLRFFDDGFVISTSSTNTPVELKPWFTKSHVGPHGTVRTDGEKISFTTQSTVGMVEYTGTPSGNSLELTYVSKIPGYEGRSQTLIYTFVKTAMN